MEFQKFGEALTSVKTPKPPTRHKQVAMRKSCREFRNFDSNNNQCAVNWSGSRDEPVSQLADVNEGVEADGEMSFKEDVDPAPRGDGRAPGRSPRRPASFSSTPRSHSTEISAKFPLLLGSNTPKTIQHHPVVAQIESSPCDEIASATHQGLLTDQLRGKKVWGAICGHVLCIYETDHTSVPLRVIQMMECKVRPIEFQFIHGIDSAIRGSRQNDSSSSPRINKHQFVIENVRSRQKQMFGVSSKPELDHWISNLIQASVLYDQSKLSEDTGVFLDSTSTGEYLDSSGASTESLKLSALSDCSVTSRLPSPLLPKKRDTRSLSFSVKQRSDVKTESVDEFRKFLRREHQDDPLKTCPLKPSYVIAQQQSPASDRDDETARKSRSFLKTPLEFLLRRKKRSSSADDAKMVRRKVASPRELHGGSESSASSYEDNVKHSSSHLDSCERASLQGSLERSPRPLDRKLSQSLSKSLQRTATGFRDRILRSSKSREVQELKLRDLGDLRLSGFLQFRLNYKFTKVFCALCRGWFYVFKTNKPECVPCSSVMLSQCSVAYVSEMEERKKSLFAFKLCQPGCPSVYLLADDQLTLAKWMISLQAEGSKVQMDVDLAVEVHERRSPQKVRRAQELGMSPKDRGLAKEIELKLKRHSCPAFRQAELDFLAGGTNPTDADEKGDDTLNEGTSEKGDNLNQLHVTVKFTGLPPDISEEEYSEVPWCVDGVTPTSLSEVSASSTADLQQTTHRFLAPHPQSTDSGDEPPKTQQGPPPCIAISPESKPSSKPLRVRASQFSLEVKNESEKFLQSALAAVRRTASLDKAVIQRPSLTRPPSLYLTTSLRPRQPDDGDMVTSFFHPSHCSPEEVVDTVDFGGHSSETKRFLELDSPAASSVSGGSHVVTESYTVPSKKHETALKEAWSKDPDFLMGVIKDKLRLRSQNEAGPRDVMESNETVLIVSEEWGAEAEKKKHRLAPQKRAMESGETSDSSDTEKITQFTKHPSTDQRNSVTSESMSVSSTGSVNASSTESVDASPSGSMTIGLFNSGADSVGRMQGFVEKRGFDDKWTRFWCVLREACLFFYLSPDDRASTDVTDLRGYEVNKVIDSFPGKRFILSLDHKDYITVVVSLDSRDDLTSWYQAIKAVVGSLDDRPSFSLQMSNVIRPSGCDVQHQSPSAQTVKEKLLAEMLRQKEELEKIQAARMCLKNQDPQTHGSPLMDTADQICELTRLKQRRMSTQIRLDTIKKHMGDNSAIKEKKTVFQIGRKKPDLVPPEVQGKRNDLEEQVKSLSSRLEALDTCITSHGATGAQRTDSTDKSILKKGSIQYASDLSLPQTAHLVNESRKENFYGSNGDISPRLKDKDMSRSTSLKSSVQKLAYRTFGRANWHWNRKSTSPTDDKRETRVDPPTSPSNYLSEITPDVIDMTNNNNQINGKLSLMADGKDICAPPDSFKTEYTFLSSTLPKNRGNVSMTTSKDYTMSMSALSSSSAHLDRFNKRLIPSSSFPSLVESNIGQTQAHHFLTAQKTKGHLAMSNAVLDHVDSSSRPVTKSRSASLRREVTPSTLAQIEAFEELSNKFLKDFSK